MNPKLTMVLAIVAITALFNQRVLIAQQPQAGILRPRQIGNTERIDITNLVVQRFQERVPGNAEFRAAGAYRFVSTDSFQYMDRTDIGSIAFESAQYGTGTTRFDSTAISRNDFLKQVDVALARGNIRPIGKIFAGFQNEFAGATQPRGLTIEIDPRSVSQQVARTAEYSRVVESVPVFGSELLIGFMPDGRIGRFRIHWPDIPPTMLRQARELQKSVSEKRWTIPQQMRGSEFQILEVSPGVGHSGFADPQYKVAPVVRVLYRKVARDRQYPLSSTGYKYFDASGQEILFSAFPVFPGTAATAKPPAR